MKTQHYKNRQLYIFVKTNFKMFYLNEHFLLVSTNCGVFDTELLNMTFVMASN
jgi:hypothetical protein